MEYLSMIVAFVALGLSAFTFSVHSRQIRRLRRKIDESTLSQESKNLIASQKAFLVATISSTIEPNKKQISIRNDGLAIASNIRFKFIHPQTKSDISHTFKITTISSPEINPKEFLVLDITYISETPNVCQLIMQWDDDHRDNNTRKQLIHLK